MLSIGTLFRAAADIFLKKVNQSTTAKSYFLYTNTMFNRASQTLQKNPNIKCTHVKYKEFTNDPIQTIQKIYNQLGYEFSDEYHDILKEYINEDKMKRKELRKSDSRIPVTLETFGCSYDDIENELGWYKEKYLDD